MSTAKLVPNDPRVTHTTTNIRGKTYNYLLGKPQGSPKDTIVLIHGFPDFSFGWRYQIPLLMSKGFRVIVPNMLGYCGTDAPEDLEEYTYKNLSADINELARKYVGPAGQIILGGHDWGGFLIWRTTTWYPELVKAVFSVCTPYAPPLKEWVSLEDQLSRGKLPNFGYQLHFMGKEVEETCQGEENVRQFLNSLHGGFGPNGEKAFSVRRGVLFDNLPILERAKYLSQEELDYYTRQFMLQRAPQLRGPLNWYRTRKLNWRDELPLTEKMIRFEIPALMITSSGDKALPPSMAKGMDKYFDNLSRGQVDASHWALTEAPDHLNQILGDWIDAVLSGKLKSNL